MGLYISGHPLEHYESRLRRMTDCSIPDLPFRHGEEITFSVGGMLAGVRERYTKKGDPMGILELEDTEGKIEVVCFPRTWVQVKGMVSAGQVCVVRGRVQERGGLSILADGILPLEVAEKENDPSVRLRLNVEGLDDGTLREIYRELKGYPGGSPVLLEVLGEGGEALLRIRDVKVNPVAPLQRRFDTIAPGRVEVVV